MLCIKNKLGEFIRQYRGNQSLREFAHKCGISHTHLDSIEKGIDPRSGKAVRITIDTLKKIAKAMNMSINELLIKSGEVSDEQINNIKTVETIQTKDNFSSDDIEILNLLKDLDKEKNNPL